MEDMGSFLTVDEACRAVSGPRSFLKRLRTILSAEVALLKALVKSPFEKRLVSLRDGAFINTLVLNEHQTEKPVLVLAHGWGSGLGFFAKNLDALAGAYRIYCFDWIGSGGSSRPKFDTSMNVAESEDFFLRRFDEWTKRVGLENEKFILAGHSLGGYLPPSTRSSTQSVCVAWRSSVRSEFRMGKSHRSDQRQLLAPIRREHRPLV